MPELAEKGQAFTPRMMQFFMMKLIFTDPQLTSQDYVHFGHWAFRMSELLLLEHTVGLKHSIKSGWFEYGSTAANIVPKAYVVMIGES